MTWRLALAGAMASALVAAAGQAAAAGPASATASANAQIIGRTLNITPVNPLAFGRIKSSAPGTVTVTVAPQRSADGGVVLIGSGQCNTPPCDTTNQSNQNSASFWSPAIYTVAGTPNATYRVSAESTTATATLKSGSGAPSTLQVTGVNVATDSSGYTSDVGTLNSSGQGTVRVGGTLQVTVILNASSYYLYDVNIPVMVQYN